jgi:hypothetical protein
MRNLSTVLALVTVLFVSILGPAVPASSASAGSAPADEYFGRMKLSYLGINNSLKDATIMAGDHTDFSGVVQKIQFAEDAFLDWERKYPKDPQLARSMFLLARAYIKVWTADGQQKAALYYFTLTDKYGSTYFGKQAKADLSKGLTMHVYAAVQPCQPIIGEPTPTPAPAPTANSKRNIKVQIEPAPTCSTPAPTPAGQPIPVPTPAVAPTPGPLSTPAHAATPTGAPAASPQPASSAAPAATPATGGSPTPTPAHT